MATAEIDFNIAISHKAHEMKMSIIKVVYCAFDMHGPSSIKDTASWHKNVKPLETVMSQQHYSTE